MQMLNLKLNKFWMELRHLSGFFWNNHLRQHKADLESIEQEGYWTSDKKNGEGSKINLQEGADCNFVATMFHCGLIDNLYLSPDLKEAQRLPKAVQNALKNFQKKINNYERHLYMKCYSSIPYWSEKGMIPGKHVIRIGFNDMNSNRLMAPPAIFAEREEDMELLHDERALTLQQQLAELHRITCESKIKVNAINKHCLIFSATNKIISTGDQKKWTSFESAYVTGEIPVPPKTLKKFCKLARRISKSHLCPLCRHKRKNIGEETSSGPG